MFDNVGEKIEGIATFVFYLGVTVSILLGLYYFYTGLCMEGHYIANTKEILIVEGIVIPFLGGFISWIISLLVYGLGLLIENSSRIVYSLHEIEVNLDKNNHYSINNF